MGWNIALMAVKAGPDELDEIMPDVFGKTASALFFEDAASVNMGQALGVTACNGWIIITDVQGRCIADDRFPVQLSKSFEVKTYWIAEDLICRCYRNGACVTEVKGIKAAGDYLLGKGIEPADEWGETRIIQLFEAELFPGHNDPKGWEILFEQKFDKYELD
jgi:hypothetical protein